MFNNFSEFLKWVNSGSMYFTNDSKHKYNKLNVFIENKYVIIFHQPDVEIDEHLLEEIKNRTGKHVVIKEVEEVDLFKITEWKGNPIYIGTLIEYAHVGEFYKVIYNMEDCCFGIDYHGEFVQLSTSALNAFCLGVKNNLT